MRSQNVPDDAVLAARPGRNNIPSPGARGTDRITATATTRLRPNGRPVPVPAAQFTTADDANPVRKLACLAGMGLVFAMFGNVAELLSYVLHTNTYLLYIFAPAAYLGVMTSGGIGRTLKGRAAWYWVLFFTMMILSVPFSTWRGASLGRVLEYARFTMPLMFVIGGLAVSWQNVRSFFYAIALGGLCVLLASRLFSATDQDGRVVLATSGTLGNSNDLASHLVLTGPFLLYIVTDPKRNALTRSIVLIAIGYSLWVILGTASRGALIAVGVVVVFLILRGSTGVRTAVLAGGLAGLVAMPILLPGSTVARLASLFGGQHTEAQESEESRIYLLKQSVVFTLEHPLFGVGADQFTNYEGLTSIAIGEHGEWHETHNSWTQISSECGIPALVFFAMGIASAFSLVNGTWKRARKQGATEISRACFCYIAAFSGYMATITFLSNAYRFYLPAMIGLAIAIYAAGNREMDENPAARRA